MVPQLPDRRTHASSARGRLLPTGVVALLLAASWAFLTVPGSASGASGVPRPRLAAVGTGAGTAVVTVDGVSFHPTGVVRTGQPGRYLFGVPTPRVLRALVDHGYRTSEEYVEVAGKLVPVGRATGQAQKASRGRYVVGWAVPPAITRPPADDEVTSGSTATFVATAAGTPRPSVQWEQSSDGGATWSAIAGARSSTYAFVPSPAASGDELRAVFVNAVGDVASAAATLTVATAPSVVQQPADTSVVAGALATFTAVATGSPDPTVQWWVSNDNGATFTPIPGATATTYSLAAAPSGNEALYEAVFSNVAGRATSTPARLGVLTPLLGSPSTAPPVGVVAPPPSAPAVSSSTPADVTADAGQTATFSTTAAGGTAPYTYQWQVSTDNGATFTNVPSGGTAASYTTGTLATAANGDRYRVVVTDHSTSPASVASGAATVTVNAALSTSSPTSPGGHLVNSGSTATVTTTASGGTAPYTYQWQVSTDYGATFTNVPSGGTAASYTTGPITGDFEYRVLVSDSATTPSSVTSGTLNFITF